MTLVDVALGAAAVPALLASGYLFFLAVASRRKAPPPPRRPRLRFDLWVPAHDEEAGIARTVRSLLSADYPAELRRVLVVADNCRDATAARARAAGAEVLVRDEPDRRGKGYALAHAFDHSLRSGFADAVVVVDADSVTPANLLTAFAARLEEGAQAVQAGAAVLNAADSWRTQLLALAFALFNGVRSLARENLGLSCGLRGNGMCLSTALVRAHPPRAFSIVEDLEYGLRLGHAGVRVRYAGEAQVASAMVSSEGAARSQRRRWEQGRVALARQLALPLLCEALARRSLMLLDLALDLLVPPLSFVALYIAAGAGASLIAAFVSGSWPAAGWLWLASVTCVAVYVARGWALSGIGLSAALHMPRYVLWKALLVVRSPGATRDEWVRTSREEAR